jgi:hypothetical protein
VACPALPGAGKEEIATVVARTRREERLAADQRLTQALQNQQQRLQQQHQQQLQQQQQQQASPARRQDSHMNVNLSDSSEVQALQRDLADALARWAAPHTKGSSYWHLQSKTQKHGTFLWKLGSLDAEQHYGLDLTVYSSDAAVTPLQCNHASLCRKEVWTAVMLMQSNMFWTHSHVAPQQIKQLQSACLMLIHWLCRSTSHMVWALAYCMKDVQGTWCTKHQNLVNATWAVASKSLMHDIGSETQHNGKML